MFPSAHKFAILALQVGFWSKDFNRIGNNNETPYAEIFDMPI